MAVPTVVSFSNLPEFSSIKLANSCKAFDPIASTALSFEPLSLPHRFVAATPVPSTSFSSNTNTSPIPFARGRSPTVRGSTPAT